MITEESHQYSNELLKKVWEIENPYMEDPTLTVNERKVVEHFKENHDRDAEGRFVVPLPLNLNATPLGDLELWLFDGSKPLNNHYILKHSSRNSPLACRNISSLDTLN